MNETAFMVFLKGFSLALTAGKLIAFINLISKEEAVKEEESTSKCGRANDSANK